MEESLVGTAGAAHLVCMQAQSMRWSLQRLWLAAKKVQVRGYELVYAVCVVCMIVSKVGCVGVHLGVVLHRVRIGEQVALALGVLYDKGAAGALHLPRALPGQPKVWLQVVAEDLDDCIHLLLEPRQRWCRSLLHAHAQVDVQCNMSCVGTPSLLHPQLCPIPGCCSRSTVDVALRSALHRALQLSTVQPLIDGARRAPA